MVPRGVLVERPSEYEELLARHATHEQVRFFLERRERSLEEVLERHATLAATHRAVLGAVPPDWRVATVLRADLDRFLFEPGDVVLALGQDGLVANVAKYLDGQPVIGLNPDPGRVPGVLVRHAPEAASDLLSDLARVEHRTMVRAALDDGQEVLALNEVFVATPRTSPPATRSRSASAASAPELLGRDRHHRHGRDAGPRASTASSRHRSRCPARRTASSPSSCARRGRA